MQPTSLTVTIVSGSRKCNCCPTSAAWATISISESGAVSNCWASSIVREFRCAVVRQCSSATDPVVAVSIGAPTGTQKPSAFVCGCCPAPCGPQVRLTVTVTVSCWWLGLRRSRCLPIWVEKIFRSTAPGSDSVVAWQLVPAAVLCCLM